MSPGADVIDSPALDAVETDSGIESPETEQPSEQPESQIAPPPDGQQPTVKPLAAGESAITEGKLAPQAKATLATIRATDPVLAKQLERALYQQDTLRREFPGGWKDVQQLRGKLEEWGGEQGIGAARDNSERLQTLDDMYTGADPRFIDELVAKPEGQQGFVKLAPQMFSKFAELHPEGYSNYIAQTFLADMGSKGIPLALEKLSFYLGTGNATEAKNVLDSIVGYYQHVQKIANTPVAPKEFAKPNDTREQELAQREQQTTLTEWGIERDRDRMATFEAEWKKATEGRKISDTQAAHIKELYVARLSKAVNAIPQFEDTLKRFLQAGDKQGYLKYLANIHRQQIPRALAAAVDAFVPGKPGPKPVNGNGLKANPRPELNNPASGATWLPGPPKRPDIDYMRTNAEMISKGRAVLKTGKTVAWKV